MIHPLKQRVIADRILLCLRRVAVRDDPLERLRKAGAALPCVALAFGPGLVVEAMLVV